MFDVSNDQKSSTRMGILIKRTGIPPPEEYPYDTSIIEDLDLIEIIPQVMSRCQAEQGSECPLGGFLKDIRYLSFRKPPLRYPSSQPSTWRGLGRL